MFILIFSSIFQDAAIQEKLTLLGLKTDNKLEAEQNCIIRNFMIHILQIC
jgi:hypothetical protein